MLCYKYVRVMSVFIRTQCLVLFKLEICLNLNPVTKNVSNLPLFKKKNKLEIRLYSVCFSFSIVSIFLQTLSYKNRILINKLPFSLG